MKRTENTIRNIVTGVGGQVFADFSGLTVTDAAKRRLSVLQRDNEHADAV